MTWTGLKRAIVSAYGGTLKNRTLQMAAALSYYLVLSVFPALIIFFAAVSSLPFPNLYNHIFSLISGVLPAQTVPAIQTVLLDILATNHRA